MVLILIFIVLAGLVAVGVMLASNYNLSDGLNALGFFSSAVSGIAIVVLTLMFSISHGTANATLAQYHAIKETIEVARQGEVSDIERAALTQKIMRVNQDIASYKYWNGTIFHLMIPDKLAELEPLK